MITVKIRYTGDNGSARAFADKNSWTKYTRRDRLSTNTSPRAVSRS